MRRLRRLYSTFAGGWPGAGLVLMRIVIAIVLVHSAVVALRSDPPIMLAILSYLLSTAAIFLIAGLYTPIAGTLVALAKCLLLFSMSGDWLLNLLVATFGAALAMLGPGSWSIDARLFGWRRIEPSPRRS